MNKIKPIKDKVRKSWSKPSVSLLSFSSTEDGALSPNTECGFPSGTLSGGCK